MNEIVKKDVDDFGNPIVKLYSSQRESIIRNIVSIILMLGIKEDVYRILK